MPILVIHHHVRDYREWKVVFDGHEEARRAYGASGHRVYNNPDDPNSVVVHVDFPTRAQADAFLADLDLSETIARGGVEGAAHTRLLDEIEQLSY